MATASPESPLSSRKQMHSAVSQDLPEETLPQPGSNTPTWFACNIVFPVFSVFDSIYIKYKFSEDVSSSSQQFPSHISHAGAIFTPIFSPLILTQYVFSL